MGIGPFDSFSFPDVYTQTINEPPRPTAAGSLRFPAFIGVGEETFPVKDYEMIRGSSSLADNKIVKENVSSQFTGTNRNFTVTYYPVVTGNGTGTPTENPIDVTVEINGFPVPVASVDGDTGEIYLVNIPATGDEVLATYYFKRKDELHTDEDLSDQVDGVNKAFKVHYAPIVEGDNGGTTTTDVTKVTVKVNNVAVTVSAVDGDTGIITLASAPGVGTTVLVTYYSNEWQETADILPSPYVDKIVKVGYAPGSSDFIEGTDFILDTTGEFFTLNWGHSYKIASGQHTIATEYFDDTQIAAATMYDNRNFRRLTTGTSDGTNKTYTLEGPAMSGQGLGLLTDDPSKVSAYYGISPTDASSISVLQVNSATASVVLASAPPIGSNVYVTQYANLLPDDVWTLENTVAGGTGIGQYTLSGVNTGTGMDVLWSLSDTTVGDTDFASENVTYPAGTGPDNRDTQVTPGYAVAETVTLTFFDATAYIVSSSNPNGSGTGGDNTGYLNQTYIDVRTGFRVTVMQGATVIYAIGDKIGYTVTPTFTCAAVPTRAIPGLRVAVANTTGVGVGDTAVINTYNKSGNEPNIGDFYYVTFDEAKQFNSSGYVPAKLYTSEKDVLTDTGKLTIRNRVGLASNLCFLNGAAALAILQVQRATGSEDAPDSRYIAGIDYFNEPMEGGLRPSLMQPVTTSAPVISYLKTSNTIQSGIRYANERMSYYGFPIGTTPSSAQTQARAMNSELMVALYPDGAITTIQDDFGNDIEYLVDGSMLAAAVAGRDVTPAFDVAEPMTYKPIVGFRRLYRRMDSVTASITANAGITLLQEEAAQMKIRFALTTDLTSVLTRTPSVVKIKQFVQRGSRAALQTYIGQKFLAQKTNEIEKTLGSYLQSLKQGSIINAYTGVKAKPDANDPTIVRVEAAYSPVFPLLWIVITYSLRSSI